MIKVIIAGGRDFNDYDTLDRYMHEFFNVAASQLTIVSGGARGADQLGELYARNHGIEIEQYIPEWNVDGVFIKSAGYKRNELMADNATHLIAFWDGKSKGTKHMIDIAERKGLILFIIRY